MNYVPASLQSPQARHRAFSQASATASAPGLGRAGQPVQRGSRGFSALRDLRSSRPQTSMSLGSKATGAKSTTAASFSDVGGTRSTDILGDLQASHDTVPSIKVNANPALPTTCAIVAQKRLPIQRNAPRSALNSGRRAPASPCAVAASPLRCRLFEHGQMRRGAPAAVLTAHGRRGVCVSSMWRNAARGAVEMLHRPFPGSSLSLIRKIATRTPKVKPDRPHNAGTGGWPH